MRALIVFAALVSAVSIFSFLKGARLLNLSVCHIVTELKAKISIVANFYAVANNPTTLWQGMLSVSRLV